MSLLLAPEALLLRRGTAAGGLAALADSLAADLAPLTGADPYVPREKALLSRAGGRCPSHGVLLDFDPWSPHEHRCPVCGERYRGELHDRFWIYWYQLWLAERAVHAAVLHAMRGEPAHAAIATRILETCAERYLTYPNVDNVLGPTRPFFSTYLESIWLLQLCVALDLLERADGRKGRATFGGRMRDRLIEPSAALIASYDEGMSNRQVWNNAALIAANRLLERPRAVESATFGGSGLATHLLEGLLSDGSWYEGENYHLFSHRGLWYGVAMSECAGIGLPAEGMRRFEEGFASPFLTALPDMTLPSRRDSQFAISLRQWRFAEVCELGLGRGDDDRLAGMLARLYGDEVPAGDTGRARSSAEAERNVPPSRLSRADLGWRSLLFAREHLPPLEIVPSRSVLLEGQGFAVLRREGGRVYASLDFGHAGGGHGHPDRLNVMLMDGGVRWLDDVGTGSYVDASLHWYRSTLAHNAPLINGHSQQYAHGRLLAFDDGGGVGWVAAEAEIAPGVVATRRIVAMPDYLIDLIEWNAASEVTFDLPLHLDAWPAPDGSAKGGREDDAASGYVAAPLEGLPDQGFEFVHDSSFIEMTPGAIQRLRSLQSGMALELWISCVSPSTLWRCRGPGAPGHGEQTFTLVRTRAQRGRLATVLTWRDAIDGVSAGASLSVDLRDGTRHDHESKGREWAIHLHAGTARSTIELRDSGQRGRGDSAAAIPTPDSSPAPGARGVGGVSGSPIELVRGRVVEYSMGASNYRRSEETWEGAGRPRAIVRFRWDGDILFLGVDVFNVDRSFVPPGTINILDNESADINGAGVQIHCAFGSVPTAHGRAGGSSLDRSPELAGWLLVPREGSDWVEVRSIGASGSASALSVSATWVAAPTGYRVAAQIAPFPADVGGATTPPSTWLDVIVNEKPFDRARRRGQLVLGGAEGEFVYLRGDRDGPSSLIPVRFRDREPDNR